MFDVVVVGAGQAGLSIGYYLKQSGYHFVMVDDQGRVGDSWRKRYDSLVLFTPNAYSSLPGMDMQGDAEALPTKDEVANYLEKYVLHFSLPVQLETVVQKVEKVDEGFEVVTNKGILGAKQIVIATGAFQKPLIPAISNNICDDIDQFHSSMYRSSKDIKTHAVLVVGGGNSGAQIAVELADTHEVTIATSHPFTFLPTRLLGRNIFTWLEQIGLLYAGSDTKRGRWFRQRKDPIFGFDLKSLIKQGKIQVKPKVVQIKEREAVFHDGSTIEVETIIWSTGFIPHYKWVEVEGALDEKGFPLQARGISPIQGLYYIGLPWQYQRGSALICGVGRDAKYIVDRMNQIPTVDTMGI